MGYKVYTASANRVGIGWCATVFFSCMSIVLKIAQRNSWTIHNGIMFLYGMQLNQ